jgi:hypothetical protein
MIALVQDKRSAERVSRALENAGAVHTIVTTVGE